MYSIPLVPVYLKLYFYTLGSGQLGCIYNLKFLKNGVPLAVLLYMLLLRSLIPVQQSSSKLLDFYPGGPWEFSLYL